MVQLKGIRIGYKKGKARVWESEEINLELPRGTITALMGKSGCGKTTLLQVAAGVKKPFQGEILLDGRPMTPKTAKIAYIPQDYGLLPWKTIEDNCYFCTEKNKANGLKLEGLLRQLAIWELKKEYPGRISGGQAQRAALARGLLMEPQVLLMDEPFSALDEEAARQAQILTRQLWKESGAAGFFVTHRMEEAVFMADQIFIMEEKGKLQKQ